MSKPAASQATGALPPKKSKTKLIMIVVLVLLLVGGGAAAFFLMKPSHPANPDDAEAVAEEALPDVPPTYAQLGTFTANLMQENENGDRYLQVAIELKITKPELTEKIKAVNPEIQHRINMLLQSKRPSELASFDGKQKLAEQTKAQVEYVLGLRKTEPAIADADATPGKEEHAVQSASAETQSSPTGTYATAAVMPASPSGIAQVLFTSFIIQ